MTLKYTKLTKTEIEFLKFIKIIYIKSKIYGKLKNIAEIQENFRKNQNNILNERKLLKFMKITEKYLITKCKYSKIKRNLGKLLQKSREKNENYFQKKIKFKKIS